MAPRKKTALIDPNASTEATTPAAPAGDAAPTAAPDAPKASEASADAPKDKTTKAPKLPKKIKLTGPYGFLDENDQPRMWAAGHVSEDPEEIKLLVGLHKVEHEDLTE